MAAQKEGDNDGEWEEKVMMMELPNGANLNATKKDIYLQVAGLWSEQPVIKLDNMLYVGKVSETLGSHLFVESGENKGSKQAQMKMDNERLTLTSDTHVQLQPIYLERKSGESQQSNPHQEEVDKIDLS